MRKRTIHLFILIAVLSIALNFVPNVFSQSENIKVLSHSWYIDSLGYFVVVGEIQNIGSATIDRIVVGGTVYTIDGIAQANSYTTAYVRYLVPQQKAVFYMEFSPTNDDTGETWIYSGIDHVDFTVLQAEATSSYQYPDLTITISSAAIGSSATDKGVYWVNGVVQNTGTQTAKNIRVIAAFYNASGTVVATGYTNPLTPTSLSPSGTASFKVGAFDMNQTEVPSSLRISSYALLIQAESPILTGTAPLPSDTEPTNSSSPSNPDDQSQTGSFPFQWLYVIGIVAVVGIALTALTLKKHKSSSERKSKSKVSRRKK